MFNAIRFRPKLFDTIGNYDLATFLKDLIAGVTVGIVALPLAMAFGIGSGVKPEQGLYTAIIAGFLISFFGGSKVQIGGPTGAFMVILYNINQKHGFDGLLLCGAMAGVILVLMGLFRMGTLIKYIPYPITSGFTSGIAVLIALNQVKDFLGLTIPGGIPADFTDKVAVLLRYLSTVNVGTFLFSISSLAIIVLWPRIVTRRIPGSIIALLVGTLAAVAVKTYLGGNTEFFRLETIGDKFGGIPSGLPAFHAPEITFARVKDLLPDAMTIALLAAIESLLCAVVADGLIGDRHDSNTELVAQGIANMVVPFFGGIAATGAIARTATNIENGGKTPIAGLIHALTLLLIVLIAAPLAKSVPLAILSAVTVMVAFNMGEWHEFTRLRKMPRSDAIVLVATFALTVIMDLTVAVEVGMVMAAFLFIKRVSETTQVTKVTPENEPEGAHHSLLGKEIPVGVMVYRIYGPFFFGAAEKLEEAFETTYDLPRVLILKMHTVPAMDATALNALESLFEKLRARHCHLILSAPHTQPFFMMTQAGFIDRLGNDNVTANLDDALDRSRVLLAEREHLKV
jgi:sulfate permease, SulP family